MSPFRKCWACLLLGLEARNISDSSTGLCDFHSEHGREARPKDFPDDILKQSFIKPSISLISEEKDTSAIPDDEDPIEDATNGTMVSGLEETPPEIRKFTIRGKTPLEISDFLVRMLATHGMTKRDLSEMIGIDSNQVSEYCALQKITPEVRTEIERTALQLTLGALREIRLMKGTAAQRNMFKIKLEKTRPRHS